MEFYGKLSNVNISFTGDSEISFKLTKVPNDMLDEINKLYDQDLEIKFQKKRHKRSADANAYLWVLIDKLAEKLNLTKEEVYRHYIKDVGVFETVPIKNIAVETWIKNWESKGLGWVCESLGTSKLEGYTNIVSYYGSSVYDTKQMARLINSIVEDCKTQGIATLPDEELQVLVNEWRK